VALIGVFTVDDHDTDHDAAEKIATKEGVDVAGRNETNRDSNRAQERSKWQSVAASSVLKITAVQGKDPFEAEFTNFTVLVDEHEDATPQSLDVTIQSSSFNSGVNDRDQVVSGSDWLEAAVFPQASYRTTEINMVDGAGYQAQGLLEIRAVEAEVSITFSYAADDTNPDKFRRLSGSAEFDRFELDLGRGDFADESAAGRVIKVEFDLLLAR